MFPLVIPCNSRRCLQLVSLYRAVNKGGGEGERGVQLVEQIGQRRCWWWRRDGGTFWFYFADQSAKSLLTFLFFCPFVRWAFSPLSLPLSAYLSISFPLLQLSFLCLCFSFLLFFFSLSAWNARLVSFSLSEARPNSFQVLPPPSQSTSPPSSWGVSSAAVQVSKCLLRLLALRAARVKSHISRPKRLKA